MSAAERGIRYPYNVEKNAGRETSVESLRVSGGTEYHICIYEVLELKLDVCRGNVYHIDAHVKLEPREKAEVSYFYCTHL